MLFELLHRYVYDYCFQSKNSHSGSKTKYWKANRNNKYEKYNDHVEKVYRLLSPYFYGWRQNLPPLKKYVRYNKWGLRPAYGI